MRMTRLCNNLHQVHSDKIFESQIILKVFGSKKAKVHKQDRQNQLRSSMPEGGEQMF